MAFLTTNPSPFIINQPELTNVITSASGIGSLSNSVTDILSYINTTTGSANVNQIGSFNTGAVTVTNNLNLSNSSLLINGANTVSFNTINGTGFLGINVNQTERARITQTSFGINTTTPGATLDVNGTQIVRGALHISSMGAAITSTLGYLYADGDIYARSILYPSDPALKTDIHPYTYKGLLPTPVEFKWKASGASDIGVLASEVKTIEPTCVHETPQHTLTVDYPKLVVLCLAELHSMRSTICGLQSSVADLDQRTLKTVL